MLSFFDNDWYKKKIGQKYIRLQFQTSCLFLHNASKFVLKNLQLSMHCIWIL